MAITPKEIPDNKRSAARPPQNIVVVKAVLKLLVLLIKAGDISRAVKIAIIIHRMPVMENDKDVSFIIHLPFTASVLLSLFCSCVPI
ncbi:MAG TPA: hypothetical protein G4O19_03505 [Dehalococcoidia bacterium]|nr:hypothetical protein [Dehalococcoidia bacterium]